MKTSRIASLAAFLTAAVGLGMSPSLFADCTTPQTFTVTSPNDDGGTGTLRFLINSASVQDCDTIEIPAMLIVLDGASGQIQIKKSITLHGAGVGSTIIDANGGVSSDRAFEIDPDDKGVGVEISGVSIRNGNVGSEGGGILVSNHGTLVLSDSEIVGNKSTSNGGGIAVPDEGGLVVENSSVSDNTSGSDGGGIYIYYGNGSAGIITGSVIDGNDSGSSGGGGIYIESGSLEILRSKVTNNKGSYGGGVWNEFSSVYIQDSEISGNISDGDSGGGIQNDYTMLIDNCDIKNNRATTSSGDGGGIANSDGGQLTIMNSTIDGNKADDQGGGIYHYYYGLTVLNCTISNNVADADSDGSGGGGGLWASDSSYTTHISGSLIVGNTSNGSDGGGGIQQDGYAVIDNCTIADNTAVNGWGGGIYACDEPTLIRNSTISGNKAVGDDGSEDSAAGGIYTCEPLLIINSTIANNEADGNGGGFYEDGDGSSFNNVTITGNVADANEGGLTDGDGGGIYNINEVLISNSIVAANEDRSPAHEAPDCFNDFTGSSNGFKLVAPTLVQDISGCEIQGNPKFLIQADPMFDSAGLADNGGPAQGDAPTQNAKTIKLADGSPAIDAGDNESCESTDENGTARPAGDNCDLGAVENAVSGGTTGGDTTGGDTTGGSTTGGSSSSGGCSLIR